MKKITLHQEKGFTLIEILLVVAAIAILAGIVILAINPGKQLGDTRNAQRRADVNTTLNAVYQYALDNNGNLPTGIPVGTCGTGLANSEICITDTTGTGRTCPTGTLNLGDLTAEEKYLVKIPNDPGLTTQNIADYHSGYYISQSSNGRVTVCAPNAEQNATISVTR